jgi:site-specific DNA-methyltransferase (adenine-specific)
MTIENASLSASPCRVVLGDFLGTSSALPDKSVSHTMTDPPYGENVHAHQFGPEGGIAAKPATLDFSAMSATDAYVWAKEMVRVTQGWVIVFCQLEMMGDWKTAFLSAGAKYQRGALWVKPDSRPQLSGDRPGQGAEGIVCVWAGAGRSSWNGHGKLGLYYGSIPRGRNRFHPTQKPLSLMEELVTDFSAPGDTIFDPFCGSGTTGLACLRWGRSFLGVELDTKYHAIASSRLQEASGQLSLLSLSVAGKQVAFSL